MKSFIFAFKQAIPVLFPYLFIGIAFGVLMDEAGYTAGWSFISGLFIYAGSMQIVMVSLLTAGASLSTIALMTFFVNARHIFYGLAFIDRFRKMGRKYPYMVVTLTDEVYSIFCNMQYPEDVDARQSDFYLTLILHLVWILSCVAGALFGQLIPYDLTGIEFSATAFFITVCMNQWKSMNTHGPAIIGLISAVVFYFILGPSQFILPALTLSVLVLIMVKSRLTDAQKKPPVQECKQVSIDGVEEITYEY
ncbi:AzlC family ABC transporter permease [Acetobacterium wieringae]|uniref:AzlC family ABC transporter permease n=1 Tax=Acetobacterium wieringae TaxID=52694 RepID=UPI0026F09607|nr:AzlC family ABC transporter permease [Acetobacterium wieringae]